MKDKEARDDIEILERKVKNIEQMARNTAIIRGCKKCGHRTLQETIQPAGWRCYLCLTCGTAWKPAEAEVDEEVIIQKD